MDSADVDQSFKISKAIPVESVVCSNSITLEAVDLSTPCTLVVGNIDGDILDLLEDNITETTMGEKTPEAMEIIEMG